MKGRKATEAAAMAGLRPATGMAALHVEGPDRPGLWARMTSAVADADINLRGLSAAVLGNRFAAYMAFDSPKVAEKAAKAIRAAAAANAPGKKSSKL